jgi:hypothetical protein
MAARSAVSATFCHFLFAPAPLKVPCVTGSPANPLAIF